MVFFFHFNIGIVWLCLVTFKCLELFYPTHVYIILLLWEGSGEVGGRWHDRSTHYGYLNIYVVVRSFLPFVVMTIVRKSWFLLHLCWYFYKHRTIHSFNTTLRDHWFFHIYILYFLVYSNTIRIDMISDIILLIITNPINLLTGTRKFIY